MPNSDKTSLHLLGTATFLWAILMSIVWFLFVPRGLSVGTFTMLSLTGPLVLLSAPIAAKTSRLPAVRHP